MSSWPSPTPRSMWPRSRRRPDRRDRRPARTRALPCWTRPGSTRPRGPGWTRPPTFTSRQCHGGRRRPAGRPCGPPGPRRHRPRPGPGRADRPEESHVRPTLHADVGHGPSRHRGGRQQRDRRALQRRTGRSRPGRQPDDRRTRVHPLRERLRVGLPRGRRGAPGVVAALGGVVDHPARRNGRQSRRCPRSPSVSSSPRSPRAATASRWRVTCRRVRRPSPTSSRPAWRGDWPPRGPTSPRSARPWAGISTPPCSSSCPTSCWPRRTGRSTRPSAPPRSPSSSSDFGVEVNLVSLAAQQTITFTSRTALHPRLGDLLGAPSR